jgi:phosphoglycolate phosphatase
MKVLDSDKLIQNFVESYDVFLLDCDGVIYNFDTILPDIVETLDFLRTKLKKKVLFVTNNSTKSRKTNAEMFNKMNIACNEDEVYCSAYLAASFVKEQHRKHAYVIGEQGICDELESFGVKASGSSKDNALHVMNESEFRKIDTGDVDAVVVGWDRSFNFYKLCFASLCLQANDHCLFVATNKDSANKVDEKKFMPVGGCMVACLEKAIGREAYVAGKPSTSVVDKIMKDFQLTDKSRMIMVGDRLDTDILLAMNSGIHSLLVLTGVTENIDNLGDIQPTFVMKSLTDIYAAHVRAK